MTDSSVTRIVQMLDLIRDISERRDVKGVITAVARRYAMLFGDYELLAIVLTNKACDCWRCFALPNPSKAADKISLQQLPPNTGMEELVNSMGYDVTSFISRPTLQESLAEQIAPFVANNHPGCGTLLSDLSAMLGTELKTVMAASQLRPLERGRSWVFLGYQEPVDVSDEVLALYDATIEITSRLTGYLSLYNDITRLEHLNQSVRRNLVHDLKTPLAVIKGCADTLLNLDVESQRELGHELVSGISEQAERLLEQLQELLAPPVESGWHPQYEEFDLALSIQKTVMAERHTERARNHHIVVEGANAPMLVRADARKIRRVIENLLSNAVKYSPGRGKTVRVSLSVHENNVAIAFCDDGLGMAPEQLRRVLQHRAEWVMLA
jgi:signal transduction histidine kinase